MRGKGVNLNQHYEFWQNKCKWFNAMPPVFSKTGFTLAEVLITLGIIGVVAALTIPSLMTAYNKHITETRLKKFYSLFTKIKKKQVKISILFIFHIFYRLFKANLIFWNNSNFIARISFL